MGIDGFLGTRASFVLDLVVSGMVAFLPLLALSVWLVKYRRRYALHKKLQITLAALLFVAVAAFEFEMRTSGWQDRARASPYFSADWRQSPVMISLGIHLCFAVSTALLWLAVTIRALRNFPDPPQPNAHSRWHLFWGKMAAIDMFCTAITGWIFYWLAFVAR